MQGLTEVLFRRSYEQCFPHAIACAVSPFISLTHGNLADAWKKIGDVLPENNEHSIAVVPQVLGREADEFVQLANRLAAVGHGEVNWNIGCPMRRVAGKHRGSGILPYPDEIRAILDHVVPRLQGIRLSVKMRLGHVDRNEIFRIIPILNAYPLASVTIHPRTGKQQYTGAVDLDTFGRALEQLRHPVIYNGDLCTSGDCAAIRNRFPQVADLMIGRGILYDPLLPLKIAGVDVGTAEQQRRHARLFVDTLYTNILTACPCDEARIRKIKEYWTLLYRSLGLTEATARHLLHAPTLSEVFAELHKVEKMVEAQ